MRLGVSTVAARQGELGEQARDTLIEHREVFPACLVAKGASQPRFADAARAGQETVPMLADPVTAGELQEQCTVQAARCAVIDILDGGEMPQLGSPGACLEAFLLSQGHLVLEQDAEPFHVVESFAFWVGRQITHALGHAIQAELAQPVDRRMLQQRHSP